ncbi:hypothetical protein CT019_21620 [Salmonella enterica]|nr:hypothetical protein [Salmonella enterica]EBT0039362.1 hypothetical protein [Salmonella enterica]ECR1094557.1 hypothetical protein [Salmonella enterica]ECS8515798.1 hypothetical protein [Salmonella enterica subsp. enterica serovar Brandenburg]EEM0244249.1 hypothetical protein [Salmonella enterica subsp. enterica serovar Brandenburg]
MNVATIHIAPRSLNAEKINSTTIYSPPNKKACDYQQACYKLSDVDGHCQYSSLSRSLHVSHINS